MAVDTQGRHEAPSIEGRVLRLLTGLFLLRVLGQLLVSRGRARFLPAMDQWQSGILPYPTLLLSQGAILGVQTAVAYQEHRGDGPLVAPRPRAGRWVRRLSVVYFTGMVVRYGVSLYRFPERRWLGKTIPIAFHCLLATYLFVYARVLSRSPRLSATH